MENVGRFRKREKPFTQISNHLLRDPNVSLKAKGLYSLIASYLSMIDFTLYKSTLRSNCSEGRDAFDKTWNELKNSGYLVQYKIKTDQGRFEYEYELLDEPELKEQDEPANKKSSSNNCKDEANSSKTNNSSIDNINVLSCANSTYGFSVPGFPVSGSPVNGNPVAIQDNLEKNNLEKNISSNNNNDNFKNSTSANCNQNSVVVKKKMSNSDISAYFEKISGWYEDYTKYVPDKPIMTKGRLETLLPALPSDVCDTVNNFTVPEALDFFGMAMDIYFPSKEREDFFGPIFNKDGYLIGYLRNKRDQSHIS